MSKESPMPPRFGTDRWLEAQLLESLLRVREAIDEAFSVNATLDHTGVDYDHYVYLRVSRKQRKVWMLLERLSRENDWLKPWRESGTLDIAPSEMPGGIYAKNGEAAAARAAARILNTAGIEAEVEEHWR